MNSIRTMRFVFNHKVMSLLVVAATLEGCRGGWIVLSVVLAIAAIGLLIAGFNFFSGYDSSPPAGILCVLIGLGLGWGALHFWPPPRSTALPPVEVARQTLRDLQTKKSDRLLPTLNRWRQEQAQIGSEIAVLRTTLPLGITTYAQLLAHRDDHLREVNLFERSATLTHGISLLERRLAEYDRALAELDQTIWQAEHMEALTRATDSPELVDRLRASIQTGQRLATERIEPTTRADLGRLAEEAFNRMRILPTNPLTPQTH